MMIRMFAILALLWAWFDPAQAQDKPEVFAQLGHSGTILAVALSLDGTLLASGSADKTIKLWDVKRGRELRTLSGHSGQVTAVAFSPNGKLLASGSDDGTIKLWDMVSWGNPRPLAGNSGGITSVAFSRDNKTLAAGSTGGVQLWDAASGDPLPVLGTSNSVDSVAFSPDGQILAAGGGDGTIELCDVASGYARGTLSGHPGPATSLAFSSDGKMLASGSDDGTVTLLDVAGGPALRTINGYTFVFVARSRDGHILVEGLSQKGIEALDVSSGGEPRTMKSLHLPVEKSVAFSPDGRMLALGSIDKSIYLWDVASGNELRAFSGHSSEVSSVAFSLEGGLLASGHWDGTVSLWDVASGRERTLGAGTMWMPGPSPIAFSPDGRTLAEGNFLDGTVKLWDVASETYSSPLPGAVLLNCVALNGRWLAAGYKNGIVNLWDMVSRGEARPLDARSSVNSVALSRDARFLASGSDDGTIKLWDLGGGGVPRPLRPLDTQSGAVLSVAFSQDGHFLASGNENGTVKLWDLVNGGDARPLPGHSSAVNSLAFSQDGQILAAGSSDKTVTLWDMPNGTNPRTLSAHLDIVTAVAFAPVGRTLASGSWDGTVRLWDTSSNSELVSLDAFTDGTYLAITPDGHYDASSPAAEENLNVRVGNSVVSIGKFRDDFYRPGLVKASLAGTPVSAPNLPDLRNERPSPPIVELIDPTAPTTETTERQLTVTLRITDTGGGIGNVELWLNKTIVQPVEPPSPSPAASGPGPVVRNYKVPLAKGDNVFWAEVHSADNGVPGESSIVHINGNFTELNKGVLRGVVVGIGEFKSTDTDNALPLAVPDAQSMYDTLQKLSGTPLFTDKPGIKLLITGDASTADKTATTSIDSIRAALQDMQAKVDYDDAFVFYVASHGATVDGKYFLITSNVDSNSTDAVKNKALSVDELSDLILKIKATRKLVIIDTCDAGAVGDEIKKLLLTQGMNLNTAAKDMALDKGITVLAAAAPNQNAAADYKEQHGLFTYWVLQGLTGEKGFLHQPPIGIDGTVNTIDLSAYVETEVPPLAQNQFKLDQVPAIVPEGPPFEITKVK